MITEETISRVRDANDIVEVIGEHVPLKRAGKDLTRDKLVRALESINMTNYDTGGFDVNFSPTNHNGSKYLVMTVITKDAKFLD